MSEAEAMKTVLTMPRELRVRLLEQLLESLAYEDDFDVPQAIIDDCLRISEAIEAGTMKTYSSQDVMARLEASRRARD